MNIFNSKLCFFFFFKKGGVYLRFRLTIADLKNALMNCFFWRLVNEDFIILLDILWHQTVVKESLILWFTVRFWAGQEEQIEFIRPDLKFGGRPNGEWISKVE